MFVKDSLPLHIHWSVMEIEHATQTQQLVTKSSRQYNQNVPYFEGW